MNKLLGSPTKSDPYRPSFFPMASWTLPTWRPSIILGRVRLCAIVKGCEAVTTSQYATISLPFVEGGVSVALLGAIYYLIVLIISIAIIDTKSDWLKIFCPGFPSLDCWPHFGLFPLQLFVIKALCLYCLVSAFSSTAIFITAIFLKKDTKI